MSLQQTFGDLRAQLAKRIIGQDKLVDRLLIALLADGHLLVEGAPGLAKTTAVKALADHLEGDFHRIQFTPDLLPSDVTGSEIYRAETGTFEFQRGPIFHNLVLADEINRAPAKVQAALLEVMQERQVTIGGTAFAIEEPFLVLATQNPIEQEGTYPLPEAQIDRFMLKIKVGYPSRDDERRILDRMAGGQPIPEISAVASADDILAARVAVERLFVDEKARNYIVDLVQATREPAAAGLPNLEGLIEHGASPRASIALIRSSKAYAFLQGRNYITPHDIQSMAMPVLRHRVAISYEAEAEGMSAEDIIQKIMDTLLVP